MRHRSGRGPGFRHTADADGGAYRVRADDFLHAPQDMIRLTGKEAAAAVRRAGGTVRAKDGTLLHIVEYVPRHLWVPARLDGLVGGTVKRLPSYHSID
ncbi:hypothetical protein VR41_03075 [Streptomyces sp. NRRL B-1568]|nr:hypothetical protein VR41_03075 [Streptomyces sp. NRRL B-1568]